MNFGYAMKLCRQHRRITLDRLAQKTQMSKSYMSLLERGSRDPTLSTMVKVANALDLPLITLMFLGAEPGDLNGIDNNMQGDLARTALDQLGQRQSA